MTAYAKAQTAAVDSVVIHDTVVIFGRVITQDSGKAISNTHVINKNTYAGTITNGIGEFKMEARVGDTLVISNVSYQFYYHKVTGKEPNTLIIKMIERNYLLDEVSITAYNITSNNPKPMTIGEPMVPKNEDLHYPEPLAPTLANPVDYLYYLFARRPKQLEKLRQLEREDYYKKKLQEGNNREVLVAVTGLPREELEAFLFYCKYSETHINTLNDYDLLVSLLACYDAYEREKAVNEILEQQEVQQKIEQTTRFKDD